ncbi:RNA polymerase sigma-70 factor (ECF subfamily) [Streptomyces sp. T12]|uniref:sigma-70 family RNA polymerase sigma factor n=1 Tax=Streptomyces sp. T12 TaxID=477697 RepID=UPI0011A25CAE|nr:sigma-70 family RNA polymerase sigma factor [Streptomyces sp. T12]TWD13520.1 RNA polymerase sigma-70 factor (ECF subfamily) [Streptomyces sp. T12]
MRTTPSVILPQDPLPKQPLHRLMADHGKALLAYAEKLLNDHHLAQDIVQETFIRAWRHMDRLYRTEGSVRGWLLTVARNLIIDRQRSSAARRETVGTDDRDLPLVDHADSVLASVEAATLLRLLSPEHQEVLLHTYLYDRTVEQTAQILGIPAGTVKSRRHYALTGLRTLATSGRRE